MGGSNINQAAIAAGLCASFLAGCAAIELSVPVNGKVAGEFASGIATARGDGNGTFWVQTKPGGPRCEGKYDSLDTSRELTVSLVCNDGRTGTVLIRRRESLVGGTALATLSDGSKGQFVYGKDVRYEEEFPGPDATAPAPTSRKRR